MKFFALASLPILVFASQSMAALQCTGTKREIVQNDQIKETTVALSAQDQQGASLQGVIDDHAFTVTQIGQSSDYLLTITVGPDYTHGVIATTTLTSDHRMEISTVDGALVYKLECDEVSSPSPSPSK